ncbi:MAG TPA: hypothetical protein VFK86_18135 [Bauldia sp.]|nr:hypothetical protein [Bauldia sp.]
MRRLVIVGLVAIAATGVWWLAEDGDLRRHLGQIGSEILDRARGRPPPSWGDVADKVGEFAVEERDLKRVVGGGQLATDPSSPDQAQGRKPDPAGLTEPAVP